MIHHDGRERVLHVDDAGRSRERVYVRDTAERRHPQRLTSNTLFHTSMFLYEPPIGPIPALLSNTATYGTRCEGRPRTKWNGMAEEAWYFQAIQPTSPQVSRTLSMSAWTCSSTLTSVGTMMTLLSPTMALVSLATTSRCCTDTSASASLSPRLRRGLGGDKYA